MDKTFSCSEAERKSAERYERVKNLLAMLFFGVGVAVLAILYTMAQYSDLDQVQVITAALLGGVFSTIGFVLSLVVMQPNREDS